MKVDPAAMGPEMTLGLRWCRRTGARNLAVGRTVASRDVLDILRGTFRSTG
jgi:predicted phosphoribosyltransferase